MTDETSDIQWFIARDGKQHGPLTEVEMRTFIAHNYLRATDLIWRPGMPEWVVATLVFPQVFQPGPDPIAPSPQAVGRTGSAPAVTSGKADNPSTDAHARSRPTSRSETTGAPGSAPAASAATGQAGFMSDNRQYESQHGGHAGAYSEDTPDRADFNYDGFAETSSRPKSRKRLAVAAAAVALLGGGALALTSYQEPIAAILSELSAPASDTTDVATVAAPATDGSSDASGQNEIRAGVSDGSDTSGGSLAAAPSSPSTTMQIPGLTVTLPPEPGSGGLTEFQTAALPPEPATQAPPSIDGSAIDAKLQKIPAWALIKSDFPDWYVGHIAQAEKLKADQRPENEVAQHLAQGLVTLRRQNAKKALAASPEKLESIAAAFLQNLKALRAESVSACYGFISKGEASPAVVQLMEDPEAATTFHAQIAAIFEAISEGSKSPHEKKPAVKADYDMLIRELGKLGWKEEDLQVFSNPRLLSQRAPDQVCKMVQDWFVAHLAVADQEARNRLLYETLKPVVSG